MRVTAAQEKVAKLEAALAALHGVDRPEVESLRAALKRAKGGRSDQGVRGFLVEGPRTSGRVGCEAHHSECEHSRCGEAVGGVATNAAVFPTSTSRRGSRTPAVARESCSIAGTVGRCQASGAGGTGFQAQSQARRFCSQLRGRVAGVDRSKTGRPSRCNVVGETRRGRQDQQHHGPCSTTVAARSCSWDDAFDGDQHCELRSIYGLRGVRVGEASHPGPVQTRNTRRLLSTQIDPDDDPPVPLIAAGWQCCQDASFHQHRRDCD